MPIVQLPQGEIAIVEDFNLNKIHSYMEKNMSEEEMMTFSEKQKLVDDFIKCNDLYSPKEPLKFDLRGYASYIKENSLKASDITPEILEMFTK